jgi:O-acetyl-ADP-ribose deacetylase (regulator of RNase III)
VEINAQLASPPHTSTYEKGKFSLGAWGKPLDSFAYFTQDSTIKNLQNELALASDEPIKAMQAFIRGESVSMLAVQKFCNAWNNTKDNSLEDHTWYEGLDEFVKNLSTVSARAEFLYSDCAPSDIRERFNISKQVGRIVENPASPTGWGKNGASLAIQNGLTPEFKTAQRAAYKPHVDEVGHAKVAAAVVVPVTDKMKPGGRRDKHAPAAVVSVRGPNRNAWYVLGGKVRLRALFKAKIATKRQEEKLRASHQAFFLGAKAYNKARVEANLKPVYDLSLLPVSANIFGYPPEAAGKIMVEEAFRFMANNPEYKVRFLASGVIDESRPESSALRDGIDHTAAAFGVGMKESKGRGGDASEVMGKLNQFTRDTANYLAPNEETYSAIKKIMTGADVRGFEDFLNGNNATGGVKASGILRGLGAITKSVGNILADELMTEAAKGNGSFRYLKRLGKLFDENADVVEWLGMGHCQEHGALSLREADRLIDFLKQAKKIVTQIIESRKWENGDFETALKSNVFDDCRNKVRASFQCAQLRND